jgi:hypothetical protein
MVRNDICSRSKKKQGHLAAEQGHLEILKWAESHVCPWDYADLFPAAAKSSNRDVYQWLFDRQNPFKEGVSFSVALSFGNFEFIKNLPEQMDQLYC